MKKRISHLFFIGVIAFAPTVVQAQAGLSVPVVVTDTSSPPALPPSIEPPYASFHLGLVPNLDSDDVSIVDTQTNREIKRVPVAVRPYHVAMSGDGRFAYIGQAKNGGGKISKIDLNSLEVVFVLESNITTNLGDVELSPDGRWLVSVEVSGKIHVFDTRTNLLKYSLDIAPSAPAGFVTSRLDFSEDGKVAFFASGVTGMIHPIELASGNYLLPLPLFPALPDSSLPTDFRDLRMNTVATGYSVNGISGLYTVNTMAQPRMLLSQGISNLDAGLDIELLGGPLVAAWNSAHLTDKSYVRIIDTEHFQEGRIETSGPPLGHLTWDPKNRLLWVLGTTETIPSQRFVDVLEVGRWRKMTTINLPIASFGLPALSQSGQFFYVADPANSRILVVDVSNWSTMRIPVGSNPRGIFMQGDNRTKESY